MQFKRKLLLTAMLGAAMTATPVWADDDDHDDDDSGFSHQVTIIQTGDFHGHLVSRPNLRSTKGRPGQMVGGLARIKTKIRQIKERADDDDTLVIHTGDTLQGGGEAMYTRGQAMVDVVDMLGIEAYAPGNWDFVYGPARFKEFFANADGTSKRWGGLVSNLYETSTDPAAPTRPTEVSTDPTVSMVSQDANVSFAEYDSWANWYVANGKRVLPPYRIRTVNGVKLGIVGCTTSRGPQVVGSWVTQGLEFTDCSREVPKFAAEARAKGAQVVVLISEIEIGRNIRIMKDNITSNEQHVDLILNSDMHEESLKPIEITDGAGNKTWIVEAGMDGTLINEITLSVKNGVVSMAHKAHRIDDSIPPDWGVAWKVAKVRYPYNRGFDASIPCNASSPYWNPFSQSATTCLQGPLSDIVGHTEVDLHRMNYSHEDMAAVVEGSSHNLIADAIQWWADSDLSTVRGFRYGQSVAGGTPDDPGAITRNDLYHIVPLGPRVGKVSRLSANQIRNQIDNSSLAVFSSDPNTPVIPLPRYNNAAYAVGGANQNVSPGAGLPIRGLAGAPSGWGGGWLFAYGSRGQGFHVNFAPYFKPNWVYNADNTLSLTPPTNTSRARSLTAKFACKYLPPAEKVSTGCNIADTTTLYLSVITTANDGVYMPNWKANYAAGTTYTPYLLNPDGWQYLNGTPNQPNTTNTVNQHFKAGVFSIAGYWYAQSPNTINNCNNCYAAGTVPGVVRDPVTGAITANNMLIAGGLLNPDVAYVLPVNVDENGNASLDANGNPKVVTAEDGSLAWENDGNGKPKPKLAGNPIDLTAIVEKYLTHIGTVNSGNLRLHRIGMVNNDGSDTTYLSPATVPADQHGNVRLPDYSPVLGFPVMQPLCGTIDKDPTSALACLQ
jgi:2',3'-cyclic-nucleotide 2'-phosphodiesterase (5'-nucleotidase family)